MAKKCAANYYLNRYHHKESNTEEKQAAQYCQLITDVDNHLSNITADNLLLLINDIGTSHPPSKTENLFIELAIATNNYFCYPTTANRLNVGSCFVAYLHHNTLKQQQDDN